MKIADFLNLAFQHASPDHLGISKGDLLNIAYPNGHSGVDTALPLNWVREVEKVYPYFSRDIAPFLVWSYREEDGNKYGTPVHLLSKILNRFANSGTDEILEIYKALDAANLTK